MGDGQNLKEMRKRELEIESRALRRLALRAERRGDAASLNVAHSARETRLKVLREIWELEAPSAGQPADPQGIEFRVNYEQSDKERAIVTQLAWTGYITNEDRAWLQKAGLIDGKDKIPIDAGIGAQERLDVLRKFFTSDPAVPGNREAIKSLEPAPELGPAEDDNDKKPN